MGLIFEGELGGDNNRNTGEEGGDSAVEIRFQYVSLNDMRLFAPQIFVQPVYYKWIALPSRVETVERAATVQEMFRQSTMPMVEGAYLEGILLSIEHLRKKVEFFNQPVVYVEVLIYVNDFEWSLSWRNIGAGVA